MAYIFGTLKTDNSPESQEHNNHWLGDNTLGIEVTRETLAERCGLGNVDPQHGGNSRSSAIEHALEWPLPRSGARLVTIRWDKDALGAMALFMLRDAGLEERVDNLLVHWIGALDRMTYSNASSKYPQLDSMFGRHVTDAMNVIVRQTQWPTLSEKVLQIAHILAGDMEDEKIKAIARLREHHLEHFKVEMFDERVAYIYAPDKYEQARNWGNVRYPVAVVFDPERKTKSGGLQERWTVVRKPDCFDRVGFEAAISAAEAKARGLSLEEARAKNLAWGGNRNIVSSPQGAGYGTKLSKEEIMAVVVKHTTSGIVS